MRCDLYEIDCPFCELPGGSVWYFNQYLHQHCYAALERELALLDQPQQENGMATATALTHVRVRNEETEPTPNGGEGYAIENQEGEVIGYSPSLFGMEQRVAVAKAMGVDQGKIAYKGDNEDDNGTFEVWGLVGVPSPVADPVA